MRRTATAGALLWTIVVGAFLILGPMYGGSTSAAQTAGSDGMSLEITTDHGLLAAGPFALIPVTVPILLCLLPILLRSEPAQTRTLAVATTVIGALVLLGMLTIGLFYVPALIALIVALTHPPSAHAPAT